MKRFAAALPVSACLILIGLMLAGCQSVLDVGGHGEIHAQSGETYLSRIRSDYGLPHLSADPRLEQAALQQAQLMAATRRMDHTTRFRRDFANRMKANGIGGVAAENIAAGHMDPAKLFSMWMNSDGHRRNMLDPRFHRFGLASATANGTNERYWALVLGD